jgi:hypothetical protein
VMVYSEDHGFPRIKNHASNASRGIDPNYIIF